MAVIYYAAMISHRGLIRIFPNFNVEVQCTPSRSALMTGRYAFRSGNSKVPIGNNIYGLVNWEVTLAETLSNAGYTTGIFGKWHLGRTPGRFPTDQGFDEWFGIPNSSDESVYFTQQGFADSGVSETYVMSGLKGQIPKKVRPYRLDYRPIIDLLSTKILPIKPSNSSPEKLKSSNHSLLLFPILRLTFRP